VEEYQAQFEELSYQIAIQNPHYDEQFYVSQFIKGLKTELCAAVESQVPDTVERAILLAMVQQEVLAEAKPWAQRQVQKHQVDQVAPRFEHGKPALKLGNGDIWKDRQLRDYRRANNLCFKCGDVLIQLISVPRSREENCTPSLLKKHLNNYLMRC
jgi:hypothetical protein